MLSVFGQSGSKVLQIFRAQQKSFFLFFQLRSETCKIVILNNKYEKTQTEVFYLSINFLLFSNP